MSNVFVLQKCRDYEGCEIIDIYSTEIEAKAVKELLEENEGLRFGDYYELSIWEIG